MQSAAPSRFTVPRDATPLSTPTSTASGESNLESPSDIAPTSRGGQGPNGKDPGKSVDPVSLRRELCAAAALQRTTLSQPEASSPEKPAPPSPLPEDSRLTSGDSASCSRAEERISQSAKGKGKMECAMDVTASGSGVVEMEIEEDENGLLESLSSQKTHSSLPDLLQRVLLIEYEKVKERQAVLVLAIHAVMLETGFVLQQPMGVVGSSDRCGLPVDWSGKGGLVNLTYTLPEIIRAASAGAQRPAVGDALLRCQVIGNALVVYGVVTGAQGSEIYRLSLPVSRYLQKDFVVEDNGNTGDALKVKNVFAVVPLLVFTRLVLQLYRCYCRDHFLTSSLERRCWQMLARVGSRTQRPWIIRPQRNQCCRTKSTCFAMCLSCGSR